MAFNLIENDTPPFEWSATIEDVINYWSGGSDGLSLSYFQDAFDALNVIAADNGLPLLTDKAVGGEQREKINAIIAAANETIPEGSDLYFDFLNDRYFGGKPDVSRNGSVLMEGLDGAYQEFGPNVPALIKGIGLQVLPQRANMLLNSAAPATQTISVVNGTVYTASVVGDGSITLSGAATGAATDGDPLTFTAAGTSLTVTVAGGPTYIQVEAGSFATPPIITSGSALTRPGDLVTAAVPVSAAGGIVGVYQMDWRAVEASKSHINFSGGSFSNRVWIEVGSSGGPRWAGILGGSSQGTGASASPDTRKTGLITVVFGVSENFRAVRVVGDTLRTDHGKPLPPNMNVGSIGGSGVTTGANAFANFEKFAAEFGPVDQTRFDKWFGIAQGWAS